VDSNCFGVHAEDRLAIDAIVASDPVRGVLGNMPIRRRTAHRRERLQWRQSQSREHGRTIQFAMIAMFGVLLAAMAQEAVVKTLTRPLSQLPF
jgi:hypothetical protein